MDSMEEIYKKHGKMIYGFLLTRTRDPGLAEELTQETFYQAVKHIGGIREKAAYPPGSAQLLKICGVIICEGRKTMCPWMRLNRYLWNPQSPGLFVYGTMCRY